MVVEKNTLYVLEQIRKTKTTFINKDKFVAKVAHSLLVSTRTIKDLVRDLELADKIDSAIWK